MAALQNSLLSRMRSARIPAANSGKSLINSSSPSHTQPTSTVSNISLFLSNLRLLDLDLLPDWPDINALTFTDKDATQGQKKRIQSVEWALYQLFALWDPEDAHNKLQPFFPPEDQLQSTNLRSALLRSLDQAKKNGVLGRDTVLRKTMLDECKGERLEDILAVFSSAVLKKLVAEEQVNVEDHPALAQSLALEQRGYAGERNELFPLILAHRASLQWKLDQKNIARAQYNDFAKLLDLKEHGIAIRQEEVSAAIEQESRLISEDEKTQFRRAVKNNWTGNELWMEALLYGDAKSRKDGVLTASFDRVWRRVRTDRIGQLEGESSVGLLEQLDGRVRVQQERLQKWKNFRREMFDDTSVARETESGERMRRQKGIDLGFGLHESLQLGRVSPRITKVPHHEEYGTLLDGLETELKHINQVPAVRPLKQLRNPAHYVNGPIHGSSDDKHSDEPLSELSELEEDPATNEPACRRPTQRSLQGMAQLNPAPKEPSRRSRPKLPQQLSSNHLFRPKLQSTEISPTGSSKSHITSPRRSPARERASNSPSPVKSPVRTLSPSPHRPSPPRSPILRTQSPELLPPSPTQLQADQILASMSAASPSPVKQDKPRHKLSLTERTRLSMVRGASLIADEEDEATMDSPSPTYSWRRDSSSRSPTKTNSGTPTASHEDEVYAAPADAETTVEDDLVARTRRSMANFEIAQQKARLDRQRSLKREAKKASGSLSRQTYFPSLGEEGKEDAESDNATVVLEELIAKEAEGVDYESVFKSRPKIKTSPPSTPARGGGMEFD